MTSTPPLTPNPTVTPASTPLLTPTVTPTVTAPATTVPRPTSTPTPGLELRGLGKHYGGKPVVDALSLTVADGELLILVGPSGSGKSTALRMIAGLTEHDSGEVLVAGRNVGGLPPAERDIAMVFQSYALFPHMTIAENLSFGMQARKEPAAHIERRVSEVLAVLALTPMRERYPRQLSGGERQRVALGRAMLRQPKLFLLDEPLSNLDAQLRVQTRAEILRLHRHLKTSMVYVTHDQIEALSLGDRVGVLRAGRLEDIGTPQSIYLRPRTLFVARFVGSPPMNTWAVQAAPPGHVLWHGARVPVSAELAAQMGPAGRALVLGVRPEHVCVLGSRWAQGQPNGDLINATVEGVEYAGDQVLLELQVAGAGAGGAPQTLTARVEPELGARRGQALQLWLAPDALHLFDAQTERSLLHPQDAAQANALSTAPARATATATAPAPASNPTPAATTAAAAAGQAGLA
jgi:multiple sugar transport system ATP-binding protein